ncbi:hypothetical protein EDD57_15218 [Baia soyae]|uniref:Uncharacterized protein n=1 Tax=Baia soyae TaxID=1544746 RepID=A0A4R2RRY9_9BACL|nr:hypothetical protein EDD57_15218 [Baia soyae]
MIALKTLHITDLQSNHVSSSYIADHNSFKEAPTLDEKPLTLTKITFSRAYLGR